MFSSSVYNLSIHGELNTFTVSVINSLLLNSVQFGENGTIVSLGYFTASVIVLVLGFTNG